MKMIQIEGHHRLLKEVFTSAEAAERLGRERAKERSIVLIGIGYTMELKKFPYPTGIELPLVVEGYRAVVS